MGKVQPDDPRVRRFTESGDFDRANLLEGTAYYLFSVANSMHEEAIELMGKHGFINQGLKYATNRLTQAFDMYNTHLNAMFPATADRGKFCKTYEAIDQLCHQTMNPGRNVVYANLEKRTLTDENDKEAVMCLRLDMEE